MFSNIILSTERGRFYGGSHYGSYTKEQEILNEKRELIISLRSILDHAFLEFYKAYYGEPLRSKNPYFPIVPPDKKDCKKGLGEYLKGLGMGDLEGRFPKLYSFILEQQPLLHPEKMWFRHLYDLANKEKHAGLQPLNLLIDGKEVNTLSLCKTALEGCKEILRAIAGK